MRITTTATIYPHARLCVTAIRDKPTQLSKHFALDFDRSIETLTKRLDYYEEAVNLAVRLEGQGDEGDISLSASYCEEPAVSTILRTHEAEQQLTGMKGFEIPITIARINLQATHDR